jgi:hypothetical protein
MRAQEREERAGGEGEGGREGEREGGRESKRASDRSIERERDLLETLLPLSLVLGTRGCDFPVFFLLTIDILLQVEQRGLIQYRCLCELRLHLLFTVLGLVLGSWAPIKPHRLCELRLQTRRPEHERRTVLRVSW